jgi:hypothetical protein
MTDGGHEDRSVTSEELAQAMVNVAGRLLGDLSDEDRKEILRVARDEFAKATEQLEEMPLLSTVADALEAAADTQEAAAGDDGGTA